jgi:hypothetical protein
VNSDFYIEISELLKSKKINDPDKNIKKYYALLKCWQLGGNPLGLQSTLKKIHNTKISGVTLFNNPIPGIYRVVTSKKNGNPIKTQTESESLHDFYLNTTSHITPDIWHCQFFLRVELLEESAHYPHIILNLDEAQIMVE